MSRTYPLPPTAEQSEQLFAAALQLLQQLIATPSFSCEEAGTAHVLEHFFQQKNIVTQRTGHNIWSQNRDFDPSKPTYLLCSHHDTVRPSPDYTRDPFTPSIETERLYGLGSNDAGGCLVSLAATFVWYYEQENLPFNLVFAAVAEEEISGKNGVESLLHDLPELSGAIVGEPTQLQLAVAEKGLMVLDGTAYGQAGHAARQEGVNALYVALDDINWLRTQQFARQSAWLGPVKMTVTVIQTDNKAHNVVPAECRFVVDVRLTEVYTPAEILAEIRANVQSTITPRSMRLRATAIALEHPLVQAGIGLGKTPFGSPTLSDKALLPVPALKVGPGDSARSHTADEFIFVTEIRDGIAFYIGLLQHIIVGK